MRRYFRDKASSLFFGVGRYLSPSVLKSMKSLRQSINFLLTISYFAGFAISILRQIFDMEKRCGDFALKSIRFARYIAAEASFIAAIMLPMKRQASLRLMMFH